MASCPVSAVSTSYPRGSSRSRKLASIALSSSTSSILRFSSNLASAPMVSKGQFDQYGRAFSKLTRQFDVAFVSFNQAFGNGKSESSPFGPGREKGVEYFRCDVWFDSFPAVDHFDLNCLLSPLDFY